MIDLTGKVAIVTGSSRGLGAGIAIEFANAGAEVIVTHLPLSADTNHAQDVVNTITSQGGKSLALPLDVTDPVSIAQFAVQVFERFARIDILINNAGVLQQRLGCEATLDDFDSCYDVNVKGLWSVSRAFIPHFKHHGEGKIINIASAAGRKGSADLNAYCASKAAVISLGQSMAAELGPCNINVNTVCPGIIWTPMWEQVESLFSGTQNQQAINQQKTFKRSIQSTPLGRPQKTTDIAYAVAFFASPNACNITGQALNVDGGCCMN